MTPQQQIHLSHPSCKSVIIAPKNYKDVSEAKAGFRPVLQAAEQLSFGLVHASQTMMRRLLPAFLLFSALLAACASDKDALTAKDIPQSGTLKVHPGLLGAPVAPQAPAKTDAVSAPAEQPGTR